MAALPQRLGPYVLEAELGRGAMGVVYRARDTRVDRVVAIKLVLTEGEVQAQRFEHEARAAARLRHKNIVAVHDLAVEGSRVYLVSEFVQGRSLQDLLKERGRLEPERAAELTARLCEGVEHAHQAGVIHRDIKPDNVLLVGQEPRLTDFGIARIDGGGLTKTGQLLGTPAFMPPEQAGGERERIGPRSDVYSLGATLYALLTGQAPFAAGSTYATVTAVLTKDPTPPSELAAVPPALEAIVLGAMAKEPAGRPPSAAALAQALRDWQAGIASEEVSRGQRRSKRLVLGLGALAILIAAGVGLALQASSPGPTPAATHSPAASPSASARVEASPSEDALSRGNRLWNDADHLDGDAALEAYLEALQRGHLEALDPLTEVLVAGHGVAPLRSAALTALERLAERGSQPATLALAQALTHGPSADPKAAQRYCAELKDQDEGRGFLWLGDYWRAKGDSRQAEIFYLTAKELGAPSAMARLGVLLTHRRSRQEEGANYIMTAAAEGIPSALKTLGDLHRSGRGVECSDAHAEQQYREAIRRGSLDALYALADLLRDSKRGYRPELEEAARRGHVQASADLSRLVLERDPARALRLTRFAVSRGHHQAAVWLAEHHFQGQGVPASSERGWALLRQASARGNPRATCALATRLQAQGEVAAARALWREEISRSEDGEAYAQLGLSLLDVEPKTTDPKEAAALLLRAVAKGIHREASLRLAAAYEEGPTHPFGFERDLGRAHTRYMLGAGGGYDVSEDLVRIQGKLRRARNAPPESSD